MFVIRFILLLVIMGVSGSVYAVKLVSAEIPYSSLQDVTASLTDLGTRNITFTDIKSLSLNRPNARRAYFIPKVKLDVVVDDAMVDSVIEAIVIADDPRKRDDDLIMVLDIEQLIRIPAEE